MPGQEFHHQELDPILGADVVEDADAWMIERRDGPRFLFESATPLRVGGGAAGQHLDGHGAPQPCVDALVDLAHPAGPQRRHDFVGPEAHTGGESHAHLLPRVDGRDGEAGRL